MSRRVIFASFYMETPNPAAEIPKTYFTESEQEELNYDERCKWSICSHKET